MKIKPKRCGNCYEASGAAASQDVASKASGATIDLRLPVSPWVTLTGSLGAVSSEFTAEETPLLLGQEGKTSGAMVKVGVRFYIH